VNESVHPSAPDHLPAFITAPGDIDVLMVVVGIVLIAAVLGVGNFYLTLHTLPERMAHKSQKLQFEIVAVLGLLALFTHNHLFWVIGLFLAMVDLPDFGTPLRRIAGSVEKIAGAPWRDRDIPPAVLRKTCVRQPGQWVVPSEIARLQFRDCTCLDFARDVLITTKAINRHCETEDKYHEDDVVGFTVSVVDPKLK
jgi:hypothetical protein